MLALQRELCFLDSFSRCAGNNSYKVKFEYISVILGNNTFEQELFQSIMEKISRFSL